MRTSALRKKAGDLATGWDERHRIRKNETDTAAEHPHYNSENAAAGCSASKWINRPTSAVFDFITSPENAPTVDSVGIRWLSSEGRAYRNPASRS